MQDSLLFELIGYRNTAEMILLLDERQIRKRYAQQVMRYHPDRANQHSQYLEYSTEVATKVTQAINIAYYILSDEDRIQQYVRLGKEGISDQLLDWESLQQALDTIRDIENFESEDNDITQYAVGKLTKNRAMEQHYGRPTISQYRNAIISQILGHRTWGGSLRFSADINGTKTWLSSDEMMTYHPKELQNYIKTLPREEKASLIYKDTRLVCHI